MSVGLSITINREEFNRQLNGRMDQARFAMAGALTNVARLAQKDVTNALDRYLDRPTPFTKKGIAWEKATKDRLVSAVSVRPIQAKYLALQIEGGTRLPTGRSLLNPILSSVKRNAYGNLPRIAGGRLVRQFATAPAEGHGSLFVGTPKGSRWGGARPGIWQRLGYEKSKAGRKSRGHTVKAAKSAGGRGQLRRLATFEASVRYRKRLPFERLVKKSVAANWYVAADAALKRALGSARS